MDREETAGQAKHVLAYDLGAEAQIGGRGRNEPSSPYKEKQTMRQ